MGTQYGRVRWEMVAQPHSQTGAESPNRLRRGQAGFHSMRTTPRVGFQSAYQTVFGRADPGHGREERKARPALYVRRELRRGLVHSKGDYGKPPGKGGWRFAGS